MPGRRLECTCQNTAVPGRPRAAPTAGMSNSMKWVWSTVGSPLSATMARSPSRIAALDSTGMKRGSMPSSSRSRSQPLPLATGLKTSSTLQPRSRPARATESSIGMKEPA